MINEPIKRGCGKIYYYISIEDRFLLSCRVYFNMTFEAAKEPEVSTVSKTRLAVIFTLSLFFQYFLLNKVITPWICTN